MKDFLKKIWRMARWPLGVLLFLYIALVIYRIPAVGQKERSEAAVERIHAARLMLDTVVGKHLPLPPNKEVNDATVAGVDNNGNGIRDDVELAIFAKYPDSPKIRAAELQYALALQLMITEVFDKETWIAAATEYSRARGCIGLTIPDKDLNLYHDRSDEVENLVVNLESRKDAEESAFKFTTSLSLPSENLCDIDIANFSS
jgi:hypothetical protein